MLALSALGVSASACGSTSIGATTPRAPSPVNLTVYISASKVSVSPASVGAGPVVFFITNQANQAESLQILPAGSSAGQPLANTGPINPQATAQVTVELKTPGDYSVATSGGGGGGGGGSITAATIHVGKAQTAGNSQLLQP